MRSWPLLTGLHCTPETGLEVSLPCVYVEAVTGGTSDIACPPW